MSIGAPAGERATCPQGNDNIFIAECKFWDGPQTCLNAVARLPGCIPWRDTKTAIILFRRTRAPTIVLAGVQANTEQRAHYSHTPVLDQSDLYTLCDEASGRRQLAVCLAVMAFRIPLK
jgi:hypothetical protein